jgi:transposase
VVLEAERWLELRRFRALQQAGASISEIARETGLNWRTVKKYLEADGPAAPPEPPPRADRGKQMIAAYAPATISGSRSTCRKPAPGSRRN